MQGVCVGNGSMVSMTAKVAWCRLGLRYCCRIVSTRVIERSPILLLLRLLVVEVGWLGEVARSTAAIAATEPDKLVSSQDTEDVPR